MVLFLLCELELLFWGNILIDELISGGHDSVMKYSSGFAAIIIVIVIASVAIAGVVLAMRFAPLVYQKQMAIVRMNHSSEEWKELQLLHTNL